MAVAVIEKTRMSYTERDIRDAFETVNNIVALKILPFPNVPSRKMHRLRPARAWVLVDGTITTARQKEISEALRFATQDDLRSLRVCITRDSEKFNHAEVAFYGRKNGLLDEFKTSFKHYNLVFA